MFLEKDGVFYDEFVEDQLLSGNASLRDMHVTVLDSSIVIMMADHVKTAQTQNEPAISSEGTLSEIQEEENEVYNNFVFCSLSIPRQTAISQVWHIFLEKKENALWLAFLNCFMNFLGFWICDYTKTIILLALDFCKDLVDSPL